MSVLRGPVAAFLLDVVCVVVFAVIGRVNHVRGISVAGVAETAWPFLLGTVIGWCVVRALRKSWPLEVGPGITVWFSTLLFGMLLRRLTGQGTALAFVLVAALTLAVLLVGWRGLVAWRRARV